MQLEPLTLILEQSMQMLALLVLWECSIMQLEQAVAVIVHLDTTVQSKVQQIVQLAMLVFIAHLKEVQFARLVHLAHSPNY